MRKNDVQNMMSYSLVYFQSNNPKVFPKKKIQKSYFPLIFVIFLFFKDMRTPSGIIEIRKDSRVHLDGSATTKKKFCFTVQGTTNLNEEEKIIIMQAKTQQEYDTWVFAINDCIEKVKKMGEEEKVEEDLVEKKDAAAFPGVRFLTIKKKNKISRTSIQSLQKSEPMLVEGLNNSGPIEPSNSVDGIFGENDEENTEHFSENASPESLTASSPFDPSPILYKMIPQRASSNAWSKKSDFDLSKNSTDSVLLSRNSQSPTVQTSSRNSYSHGSAILSRASRSESGSLPSFKKTAEKMQVDLFNQFLEQLDIERFAEYFEKEEIDLPTFLLMEETEIHQLELPFDVRMKLVCQQRDYCEGLEDSVMESFKSIPKRLVSLKQIESSRQVEQSDLEEAEVISLMDESEEANTHETSEQKQRQILSDIHDAIKSLATSQQKVEEVFIESLRATLNYSKPFITQKEIDFIFYNFLVIFELNKKFADSLGKVLKDWPNVPYTSVFKNNEFVIPIFLKKNSYFFWANNFLKKRVR